MDSECFECKKRENEKEKDNSKNQIKKVLPFFLLLGLLTVSAWMLPLRPDKSDREKRELEKIPEFSVKALLDGSYFDGINLWFSDTFTFRDNWIGLSQNMEKAYGWSDVIIYGDVQDYELPAVNPITESHEIPEETVAVHSETVSDESPDQITDVPQEIEEEGHPRLTMEEIANSVIEIGSMVQIGDTAYAFSSFNQYNSDVYCKSVSKAAELVPDCRVFTVMAPRNITISAPREYREKIKCVPEEDITDYLKSAVSSDVHYVDTIPEMLRHSDEYLFFHGDHHWTALGAYYAYISFCREAGFEPVSLNEYEQGEQGPFFGTLYYKSHQANLLAEDTVYTYLPPGDVHLFIEGGSADTLKYRGTEAELLTKIRSGDKYVTFLLGDNALSTLINNDINDGSSCMVLKDSNGNPFVYYLTQHYQYVYAVDFRYYFHRNLTSFCEYYDIDDVIFCISIANAQSDGGAELVRTFVK